MIIACDRRAFGANGLDCLNMQGAKLVDPSDGVFSLKTTSGSHLGQLPIPHLVALRTAVLVQR